MYALRVHTPRCIDQLAVIGVGFPVQRIDVVGGKCPTDLYPDPGGHFAGVEVITEMQTSTFTVSVIQHDLSNISIGRNRRRETGWRIHGRICIFIKVVRISVYTRSALSDWSLLNN